MKNKVILFLVAVCLASSPLFARKISETTTLLSNNAQLKSLKITTDEIIEFVWSKGYETKGLYQISGSENFHVTTTTGQNFIVYVTNGIIDGMTEADF